MSWQCKESWHKYHFTSSNKTFSASLALCAGNSPVTGEFPSQRPVTWSFDVFFDLCLNKRLSKHSRRQWIKTPSCSLWRHSNVLEYFGVSIRRVYSVWFNSLRLSDDLWHDRLKSTLVSGNAMWLNFTTTRRVVAIGSHTHKIGV